MKAQKLQGLDKVRNVTENYEKPPVESMHWFGTKQIKRTERWKKFSWYGETKDQANTC